MSRVDTPDGGVRWTHRSYLLFGVGGALLLSAIVFRTSTPVFLALPLLVAPLVAAWTTPRDLGRIDLRWGETGAGPVVAVHGTLTGELGGAQDDLRMVMELPPGLVETRPIACPTRASEVAFTAEWWMYEPLVVTVPAPTVFWEDPFCLVQREVGGRRPPLSVERYPLGLRGASTLRLNRTTQLPGETPSRRLGSSGEFFALRRAVPGEPLGRINWWASARVGQLMTNEFQLDRSGDLLLVLDCRPTGLGVENDRRLLGVSKSAARGIADALLREKVRVGFAAFGEFVGAVPPSMGPGHRLRVAQAISRAELVVSPGPPSRCAIGLRRVFRPGLTTLVISSWVGDPTYHLMPYLRRAGYPVMMLSPSTVPLGRGMFPLSRRAEELAERVDRLDRGERLSPLWLFGPVIDWEEFWSLAVFVQYLKRPATRRGS